MTNTATTLLRLPAVIQRVGYKKPTIYAKIKDGTFPKPVKLGERAVAWQESEIEVWIQARIGNADAALCE